nr:RNA ligase family protein [Actinorhabdospora filicis]
MTEKIDGTNATVIVNPLLPIFTPGDAFADGVVVQLGEHLYLVGAQSRNRVITPDADNYGFAAWVHANAQALADVLGPGRHHGEWYGHGINRGYEMPQGVRRFALFDVNRYAEALAMAVHLPYGLGMVPLLYDGPFADVSVQQALTRLKVRGSFVTRPPADHAGGPLPPYRNPEGVIVRHEDARAVFKVLIDRDELPKSMAA